MYLLDTNLISELRKERSGKANPKVVERARGVPSPTLFLSVITAQELEIGVQLAERRHHPEGELLRHWLSAQVFPGFQGRLLPVKLEVALRSAALHVPDPRSVRDMLIAATALFHGLTVVTRDTAGVHPQRCEGAESLGVGYRLTFSGRIIRLNLRQKFRPAPLKCS